MNKILQASKYCRENKRQLAVIFVTTAFGLFIGGYVGILAYYNGWLG